MVRRQRQRPLQSMLPLSLPRFIQLLLQHPRLELPSSTLYSRTILKRHFTLQARPLVAHGILQPLQTLPKLSTCTLRQLRVLRVATDFTSLTVRQRCISAHTSARQVRQVRAREALNLQQLFLPSTTPMMRLSRLSL